MKIVRVIVTPVTGYEIDREDLEKIEGQSFDSIDDVIKELGSDKFEDYTLCDFMDLCNDSDTEMNDEFPSFDLNSNWIGYITLNK